MNISIKIRSSFHPPSGHSLPIYQCPLSKKSSCGGANLFRPSFNLPTQDSIKTDLTERPTWYLSSYAPGKDPPAQLIDGKDISPEEARVMAYRCRAEGSLGVYVRVLCALIYSNCDIHILKFCSRKANGSG